VLCGEVTRPDGKLAARYEVGLTGTSGRFREVCNRQGRYEFFNVPPGEYQLNANPPGMGQPIVVLEKVKIQAGKTLTQNLSLAGKFILSGKVTDRHGKPVVRMVVDLSCEDPRTDAEFMATTKTDAQGRYRLGAPFGKISYIGVNGVRVGGPMPQLKPGQNQVDYILRGERGRRRAVPDTFR